MLLSFVALVQKDCFAVPSGGARGGRAGSKSRNYGKKGSAARYGTPSQSGRYSYSGINSHEAAAEKEKEMRMLYEEQLKAIREGRPIPRDARGGRREILAARRAEAEERRKKLAEERELRRLEREQKREKRRREIEERKARKRAKRERSEENPIVEKELRPTPAPTPEPQGLDEF